MNIFAQLDMAMNLVMVVTFIVMVCVIGRAVYQHKHGPTKKITKQELDYSKFERKDSVDYLRFDDIDEDMIITNNGKRFVGVLKCDGYDFYSAHPSEQVSTAQNFMGFINTITSPVSYRQHCKSIDLEDTMIMYKTAYDKLCTEIRVAEQDLKETQNGYKKQKEKLNPEEDATYLSSINEQERALRSLNFRKYHMEDQMYNYIAGLSKNTSNPKIEECWVYDWEFDPFQFSVELTDEEIKKKAVKELWAKGQGMRHALSACKVKSRRMNSWELMDICRRLSSPLSSERYKIKDVMNSSFFDDIQTSVSLDEMEVHAREVINQEVKESFLKELTLNEEALIEIAKIEKESDEEASREEINETVKNENQKKKQKKNSEGSSSEPELVFDV